MVISQIDDASSILLFQRRISFWFYSFYQATRRKTYYRVVMLIPYQAMRRSDLRDYISWNSLENDLVQANGSCIANYAETSESTTEEGIILCILFMMAIESTCEFYLTKVKLYPIPNLFLRKMLEPQHKSSPLPMIPILSPRKSA